MSDLTLGENLTIGGLSAVFALWVFALGAVLGSFLNVVVYRLPRGMPLALSVSRCPKCANPIALSDNVPILSWLRLRGRCRACGQSISPRYPLVEAAVGSLFLLLFGVELLGGGRNLPLRPPGPPGFFSLFALTAWDLVGLAAAQACLLFLLLGVALIQADRRVVPWKFLAVGGVLGMIAAPLQLLTVDGSLSPALDAVRGLPSPSLWRVEGFVAAGAGLACGTAWGVLHSLVGGPATSRRQAAAARALPVSMALVGLFLGWQAATSVALATGALRVLGWLAGLAWPPLWRLPSAGYVLAATVGHLMTWRWHAFMPLWPTHETSLILLACICLAGAIARMAAQRSGQPAASPAQPNSEPGL